MSKIKFLRAAAEQLKLNTFICATNVFEGFTLGTSFEEEVAQYYLAYQECSSVLLVLTRIHELCQLLKDSPLEFQHYREIEQLIIGEASVTGQAKLRIWQPLTTNLLSKLEEFPVGNYNFKTGATSEQKQQVNNPWTTEIDWQSCSSEELLDSLLIVEAFKNFEAYLERILQLARTRMPAEEILALL